MLVEDVTDEGLEQILNCDDALRGGSGPDHDRQTHVTIGEHGDRFIQTHPLGNS